MLLETGDIISAWVTDSKGVNRKKRPLVVISEIHGDEFVAVAISGELWPDKPTVSLPYSPYGHPLTGLKKPSYAVCDWLRTLTVSDVDSVRGELTLALVKEITKKIPKRSE